MTKCRIPDFLKEKRAQFNLTQAELAQRCGVSLSFLRSVEQGKKCLQTDKLEILLNYFGYQVGAIPLKEETERDVETVHTLEELSSHKKISYEQVAYVISRYSSNKQIDLINFWNRVLFSWISESLDIKRKDIFVCPDKELGLAVCPQYDILLQTLEKSSPLDELPLQVNGKNFCIRESDFMKAFKQSGLDESSTEVLISSLHNIEYWESIIRKADLGASQTQEAMFSLRKSKIKLSVIL